MTQKRFSYTDEELREFHRLIWVAKSQCFGTEGCEGCPLEPYHGPDTLCSAALINYIEKEYGKLLDREVDEEEE